MDTSAQCRWDREQDTPGGAGRALVVDDQPLQRHLLKSALEADGFRVCEARDGGEALALARRAPPDIVVSDIMMPGMDGFALCYEWTRDESLKHIPFVFYTASYPESGEFGRHLGAVRYLLKPMEAGLLRQELRAVLADAGRTRTGTWPVLDESGFVRRHNAELARKLEAKVKELERAYAELAAKEAGYRLLFQSNPLPMWVYEIETLRFLAVNEAAIRRYGYSREEFLAMTIADIRPADELSRLLENVARVGEGMDEAGLWRHRRKDGALIDVEITAHALGFEGRRAEMVVAVDVTEQLRAESEVKRQVARLEHSREATIEAIARIEEIRDPYTSGHERRVGDLAAAIGAELGLPEEAVHGLKVIGYLHDVGKIGLPAEILAKPGRINEIEFSLIKQHCREGYEILKKVEFPWPVAQVALQHHERLDGSGYPGGLKGDAILLEARIVAVADVVEAIASHRPYRPARGCKAALEEIERNAGRLYDPEVAAACLRLFREKAYVLPDPG